MTFGLLLASALSGAAYTLAPGPAFHALLGIGASRGRRAGAMFLGGHFVDDMLWASLSLTAIIGARTIGTLFFDGLGLVCGAYLCWLGLRSATARPDVYGIVTTAPRRPLLRGVAFGLSNPKAYPVAIAMFTALLTRYASALDRSVFPPAAGGGVRRVCRGGCRADLGDRSLRGAAVLPAARAMGDTGVGGLVPGIRGACNRYSGAGRLAADLGFCIGLLFTVK